MKAFTSIEQSKKLAEILPLESADMWWNFYSVTTDNTTSQIIHIDTPWQDIDRDRAIVIPDHSINAEVGKLIMENVKHVMDMNKTNKITLTTILEAE